jgi:hypothetical protein
LKIDPYCFFLFAFYRIFIDFKNDSGYLEFFIYHSLLNLVFLQEILFLNKIKLID